MRRITYFSSGNTVEEETKIRLLTIMNEWRIDKNFKNKQKSFRGLFKWNKKKKKDRTLTKTRKLHSTQYFILVFVLYVISFFKWKKFGLDILKLSCQTYCKTSFDFFSSSFFLSKWHIRFFFVIFNFSLPLHYKSNFS